MFDCIAEISRDTLHPVSFSWKFDQHHKNNKEKTDCIAITFWVLWSSPNWKQQSSWQTDAPAHWPTLLIQKSYPQLIKENTVGYEAQRQETVKDAEELFNGVEEGESSPQYLRKEMNR